MGRSMLADQLLTGLKGIEIGGSAHNFFGLDTINVDKRGEMDTVFKLEEMRLCGSALAVDVIAPGDDLPFEDSSWDFVFSSHVLEHFYRPDKALKEWYRVTKDGGYLFMIVPHKFRTFDANNPRTTLQEILNRPEPHDETDDHHWNVWVTEDVVELVRHLGYKIIAIQDEDDNVGNGFTIVVKVHK